MNDAKRLDVKGSPAVMGLSDGESGSNGRQAPPAIGDTESPSLTVGMVPDQPVPVLNRGGNSSTAQEPSLTNIGSQMAGGEAK